MMEEHKVRVTLAVLFISNASDWAASLVREKASRGMLIDAAAGTTTMVGQAAM